MCEEGCEEEDWVCGSFEWDNKKRREKREESRKRSEKQHTDVTRRNSNKYVRAGAPCVAML
jgi:hypothetical protein